MIKLQFQRLENRIVLDGEGVSEDHLHEDAGSIEIDTEVLPKLILSHFGMQNANVPGGTGYWDEHLFEEFGQNIVDFVKYTKINTVFINIGDWYTIPGKFWYNNPTPNVAQETIKGLWSETLSVDPEPWIFKYIINKLPEGVEVGVTPYLDIAYPVLMYDQTNPPNNSTISDAHDDNAEQYFMLIEDLNARSTGKTKITHLMFDHEGGSLYQTSSKYGDESGSSIGIGYLKWLYNKSMPASVAFTHEKAEDNDFNGAYNMGFINYSTPAWDIQGGIRKSGGSFVAYSENYWFGENNPYPGTKTTDGCSSSTDISKVLGLPSATSVPSGGACCKDWDLTTEQCFNTIYEYYKDFPELLAQIFDSDNYFDPEFADINLPRLSSKYYKPLHFNDKTLDGAQGGVATFSIEAFQLSNTGATSGSLITQYCNPPAAGKYNVHVTVTYDDDSEAKSSFFFNVNSKTEPVNSFDQDTKPGVVPEQTAEDGEAYKLDLFSFQSHEKTVTKYVVSELPLGLTVNETTGIISGTLADDASKQVPKNKIAGTFTGLSALTYENFIIFLNEVAQIINHDNPEDVTIAIYELQFIPTDWFQYRVPNYWGAKDSIASSELFHSWSSNAISLLEFQLDYYENSLFHETTISYKLQDRSFELLKPKEKYPLFELPDSEYKTLLFESKEAQKEDVMSEETQEEDVVSKETQEEDVMNEEVVEKDEKE